GGNRSDLLAHERNAFLLDLTDRAFDTGLEHNKAARHLTLERIGNADDRAFRHVLMGTEYLLNAASREPVPGHVDDVIGAAHDVNVAILVLEAGVSGLVVTRKFTEVAFSEALVLLPQGRQTGGRQGKL